MKRVPISDEWLIPALAALVGAIRVALQIAAGRPFDAGATIALVMLVLGIAGVGWAVRGAHRKGN